MSDGEAAGGERVAKVIARAGLCSRREAEALIEQGRVTVNGEKLARAAHNVKPGDEIAVDGKKLPASERPACVPRTTAPMPPAAAPAAARLLLIRSLSWLSRSSGDFPVICPMASRA